MASKTLEMPVSQSVSISLTLYDEQFTSTYEKYFFYISPREDEERERIPHTWASSDENYLKSIFGSVSYCVVILRTTPHWSVRMTSCSFRLLTWKQQIKYPSQHECEVTINFNTVNSSHLHYNIFAPGREAISGKKCKIAQNCLTSTFKNIVTQMRKGNREKGHYHRARGFTLLVYPLSILLIVMCISRHSMLKTNNRQNNFDHFSFVFNNNNNNNNNNHINLSCANFMRICPNAHNKCISNSVPLGVT